jgi:hypothetical protein
MGDGSLSELVVRCFGEGYDDGKLGVVAQYIGKTAVCYNKNEEMAEICLGEPEVIIKYYPEMVEADFSNPLSKKELEDRISNLLGYHLAYEDELKNVELIAAYEILSEYSYINGEIKADITAFAKEPEKSIALAVERARVWLDICIDRRVITSLQGHIDFFITGCETGNEAYTLMKGLFEHGKALMSEQLAGLDGNLGRDGKENLAECIAIAGNIERHYGRLVLCQDRLRKEFEIMRGMLYPENPKSL